MERPSVEDLASRLAVDGFAVATDYLDAALCADLAREAAALADDPAAIDAGVGRGHRRTTDHEIRRTRIRWIDGSTEAQARFLAASDALRIGLNRALFLGLQSFEAQLALTPPGGFYKWHFDSFQGTRNRVVSLVAYLNSGWQAEDGGCLRLWPPATEATPAPVAIDVTPEQGTVVLMMSEDVPHEVLPSHRPRTSIAGWFRLRPLDAPLVWGDERAGP